MNSSLKLVLLYPYPYKTFAVFVFALILIIIGLPIFGIYKLILRAMNERTKVIFHKVLKISGISILVIFFAELTVTEITQHQVNKQLGFNYATPETPEGEFFVITEVVLNKTMYKAGLKSDDQVQMWNVSDLYRLFIDNQGNEVVFLVLRDNREIQIQLIVPAMDLPLKRISFLF